MELLLTRAEPRQLILATASHALVLRASSGSGIAPGDRGSNGASTASPSIVVELIPRNQVSSQATLINPIIHGCLGLLSVQNETFVPIVTHSTTLGTSHRSLATSLGCEPVSRILSVEFYCLTSAAYDYHHDPAGAAYSAYTRSDHLSSNASYHGPGDLSGSMADANSFGLGRIGSTGVSMHPAGTTTSVGEPLEHPCAQMKKILCSGSFYFSGGGVKTFDLSTRLQARLARAEAEKHRGTLDDDDSLIGGGGGVNTPRTTNSSKGNEAIVETSSLDSSIDKRFLWNTFAIRPLLEFRDSWPFEIRQQLDQQGFLVLAIQGYYGTYDLALGGQAATVSLISRLGWKRAGTRFNVRGIDDEGSVANFVETETILRKPTMCFSFVQTRGSVPLFWEEGGPNPLAPKISINRPPEASLPAFIRHFEELVDTYDAIHIVNLLSHREQEAALTDAYAQHLATAQSLDENIGDRIDLTAFDFHARSKTGGIESIRSSLSQILGRKEEEFGACIVTFEGDGVPKVVTRQRGVFRTNCKDCLDRTNVVEDFISRFALEDFVRNSGPSWPGGDAALWSCHGQLFAENGDALSKIYVGTGAINTSFTRSGKSGFAGLLSNATKSVGRMYQSQFVDSGKQKAIDAFLGNLASSEQVRVFNPVNDLIRARLRVRSAEYTSCERINFFVGTYNLNGNPPGNESLLPWLFPIPDAPEPSMIVISFQEIVPLTPQMIMATDPEKKRKWEAHVLSSVAQRPNPQGDYILLRSGQLVGTALIVLIKKEIANEIKGVEAAIKKTGLKGMAGNKGAVAIRLQYRDTSFCFLTAHFAAGHSNVEERNADFFTVERGLHFSRGRTIASHDTVVYAADTNYRISLPNDQVRSLAEADDYAPLLEADQLGQVMRTRHVFEGYSEAPILFRPTYKYDNYSDTYDSSEKQRIPAWTDRILYRGRDLDVTRYQRAELRASDHRPVYAMFRARIRSIDHSFRAALRKQISEEIMALEKGDTLDNKLRRLTVRDVETLVQPLVDDSVPHHSNGLPPPSDDKQAWWNDRGIFGGKRQKDLGDECGADDLGFRMADGQLDLDTDPLGSTFPTNGTNPFDLSLSQSSPHKAEKPSSVRRKAPPPPSSHSTLNTTSSSTTTSTIAPTSSDPLTSNSPSSSVPPRIPRRPTKPSEKVPSKSLLDDDETMASGDGNGWQVIE
ncbi:BQ2448_2129 [Microbotryum intermedium]|uniref:phosphoinositide 5-phosphatase n=1 Tax=Microbotryum intermedium TaxID=269621 RepID=A0A238F8L8_9BASI|nr:BQ2448_2129 [Microbotryum intermedium]